ncbi:polyprenyl synthetase family protein [Pseudoflavonifractor sp. 60]|uniref:polyprenyl synthetase family protein n=1 Tax=Pseudoflavonifractor sp. 60 TaxID=2304576 RepID=UPI001FADD4B3|nr:farnesyl diphosphate synthase [Pseudoflavonifractor sp. 60]
MADMENSFTERMALDQEMIQLYLSQVFAGEPRYASLQEAMEYSLLTGGKRIRPILTLETCRMCGGAPEAALPFACAVEMVHTYSLIHDDLPAMDNDSLRRGRPTNHVVYGEATAILAGDALLTAAFDHLTRAELPAGQVVAAVACLSRAAGSAGMVGGQALDMAGEGRALDLEELELLQSLKTGALISAAAELGCIAAGGTWEQREQVRTYALALGRAFQVRDDMLDVISSQEELGKPLGSDQANEKSTFASALGLDSCAALVEKLTRQGVEALQCFEHPDFHIWLAENLALRMK